MRVRTLPAELRSTRPRKTPEDDLQCALVLHLQTYAMPDVIWYAVMNHGKRTKAAAGLAKGMGLVPGVYDLAGSLIGGYAWYLELKVPPNKPTDEQIAFGLLCERNGALHQVCYSLDSALNWLRAIGVLRPEAEF